MMLDALPWAGFAVAIVAAVLAFLDHARPDGWRAWRDRALWSAAALAGATFLALVLLFLTADVGYEYVFLYTSVDEVLRYRLAGVWAGREGSLALWSAWVALSTAWVARRWHDRPLAIAIAATFAAAFAGATAWQELFAATPDWFLSQRPFGNGLNPTLRSDFFIIHPPMMFLAYALTNLLAASALAHVWQGHGWHQNATVSRWNWLLYTAAMGLGGVWAYYTLGFGGYWAWDPVEVANLLPWLALTLYLHARLHAERYGRYGTMGPLLGLLPFLLTLFSTISTRSGLWISVHAFTDPTQTFNPDPAGRFLDIMAVEPALAFYVGLLLATWFGFLALWCRRLALETGILPRGHRVIAGLLLAAAAYSAVAPRSAISFFEELGHAVAGGRTGIGMLGLMLVAVLAAAMPAFLRKDEPEKLRLDVKGLGYASILTLGIGLLVLWLWHMIATTGWSTQFYERRVPLLAAPAVLGIGVFMLLPFGKRRALVGAGAIGLIGIVVGVAISAGVGLLVASGLVAIAAWLRTLRAAAGSLDRAELGGMLLATAALLNVLFWINPPTRILGGVTIHWPVQLLAIPAVVLLHRSLRHLAGAPGRERTALLTALLGGFYIAPVLAVVAWRLGAPTGVDRPQRTPQIGLYLVHFALAVALTGYAASTYLGDEETFVVGAEEVTAMDASWQLYGIEHELADGLVAQYNVHVQHDAGRLTGTLLWEPSDRAYRPLPATLRQWHGDVFLSIDALCNGSCDSPVVEAYQPTFQRGVADVDGAEITAHTLPGLGLVWLALVLFVHAAWMLAQSGIHLSTRSSR